MTIIKQSCVPVPEMEKYHVEEQVLPVSEPGYPIPRSEAKGKIGEGITPKVVVPGTELAAAICRIPKGKVVTSRDLDKYFETRYATKEIQLDSNQIPPSFRGKCVPFWRVVSPKGHCTGMGRLFNRHMVKSILETEGVPMIQTARNSYRVENLEEYRYNLFQ